MKIADELIYTAEFTQNFGKIMGLVLTFTGTGSVDHVELKDLQDNNALADSFL